MQPQHKLTEPQVALLLKLHARPAALSRDYRPLKALIEHDLVRAKHVGAFGSNPTYELSEAGANLAQSILEHNATVGKECTCGRQWSLQHDPQCPRSGKA
jgi:hypothetical protein